MTERGATEDVLPEQGLSVTEAARQLSVSRVALFRVLHGKAAISTDMALRLEAWINGPTAETWGHVQADRDLWQACQRPVTRHCIRLRRDHANTDSSISHTHHGNGRGTRVRSPSVAAPV
ncbi:HigA family addiction module antitoxin [Methylococcus capsulatus]|uniref:HigA family addiction module antitoxin n=1 Tax=Methylococcus capsulatus TaxID=414 RepID=UPI00211AEAB9|nr:HigA family addiction module antitoxin [Methylococcus capsulatus]